MGHEEHSSTLRCCSIALSIVWLGVLAWPTDWRHYTGTLTSYDYSLLKVHEFDGLVRTGYKMALDWEHGERRFWIWDGYVADGCDDHSITGGKFLAFLLEISMSAENYCKLWEPLVISSIAVLTGGCITSLMLFCSAITANRDTFKLCLAWAPAPAGISLLFYTIWTANHFAFFDTLYLIACMLVPISWLPLFVAKMTNQLKEAPEADEYDDEFQHFANGTSSSATGGLGMQHQFSEPLMQHQNSSPGMQHQYSAPYYGGGRGAAVVKHYSSAPAHYGATVGPMYNTMPQQHHTADAAAGGPFRVQAQYSAQPYSSSGTGSAGFAGMPPQANFGYQQSTGRMHYGPR